MEFITELWPYVGGHPYLFLFLGMLMGGETFLLPAVYLASKGTLSFSAIALFSALATLISDTAWYAVGRTFPLEKILLWKKFTEKRGIYLKAYSGFKMHSKKLLFISKFVYGTRTLAQILSGSVRMPYLVYSVVNLGGIMSYLLAMYGITLLAKGGLASFGRISYNEYVSGLVFILVIGIVHICLKKWLGKNFIASSSPHGTRSGPSEKS